MRVQRLLCLGLVGLGFFRAVSATLPTPEEIDALNQFGHRVHAMVQACQSPEDKFNIFIPLVSTKGGQRPDYIKRKGKICVFASGGLGNAWEKTVSHAYHVLYGERIKIIRAAWVQKHLDPNLEETYKQAPQHLHSELFFNLYANKFKRGICEVWGFSWWQPCDDCHHMLATVQGPTQCDISYVHSYPSTYESTETFNLRKSENVSAYEKKVWEDLWRKVLTVTRNHSEESEESKRAFWSEDYEGICLTKWIAQAFVCPPPEKLGLDAPDLTPQVDVDTISHHVGRVRKEDVEAISELVGYLRDVNWELSCWFKPPFPEDIQKNWLKHWKGAVIPHFAWEEVGEGEDEEAQSVCEMCDKQGIKKLFYVYHPKHAPTQKGQPTQQYKGRKSLIVGSECLAHLTMKREEVEQDQQTALEVDKERRPKRIAEAKRKKEDDLLECAEKELKRKEQEEKKKERALKKQQREERLAQKAAQLPSPKTHSSRKRKDLKESEVRRGKGSAGGKKKT